MKIERFYSILIHSACTIQRNMKIEPNRTVWKWSTIQFHISISKVFYAVIIAFISYIDGHWWSYDILQRFSINDTDYNEAFIEKYFKLILSMYIECQKNSVSIAKTSHHIMWANMDVLSAVTVSLWAAVKVSMSRIAQVETPIMYLVVNQTVIKRYLLPPFSDLKTCIRQI